MTPQSSNENWKIQSDLAGEIRAAYQGILNPQQIEATIIWWKAFLDKAIDAKDLAHASEVERLEEKCKDYAGTLHSKDTQYDALLDKVQLIEVERDALKADLKLAVEKLLTLQWASCDGCQGSGYCPECATQRNHYENGSRADGTHEPECSIGILLSKLSVKK